MYAAFLVGKNSLNFDSGKIVSTFLTFWGLLAKLGAMASTKLFSRVQDVDSLKTRIGAEMGSDELIPHKVPEHADVAGEGLGAIKYNTISGFE